METRPKIEISKLQIIEYQFLITLVLTLAGYAIFTFLNSFIVEESMRVEILKITVEILALVSIIIIMLMRSERTLVIRTLILIGLSGLELVKAFHNPDISEKYFYEILIFGVFTIISCTTANSKKMSLEKNFIHISFLVQFLISCTIAELLVSSIT